MPKAPSDFHPVRNADRLLARRDYVLREMQENGYIDKATYEAELAEPLRSVQAGDFEPFQKQLPPRDYFTDEIRRQLSRDFGEGEFFGRLLGARDDRPRDADRGRQRCAARSSSMTAIAVSGAARARPSPRRNSPIGRARSRTRRSPETSTSRTNGIPRSS